jgi:microcystin degradation protein MlrC
MTSMTTQAGALRVFVAGLAHETNSFSPLPTSLRNFEDTICYRPDQGSGRDGALGFPGYGDAIRTAQKRGDVVIEGPCFWTQPSGPASLATYHALRDEVLVALREAMPVDMVILNLHGAMMAQGVDDCEGDLLACVRELVGADVPVGVILDLHGNVSQQMVDSAAIMIGCKEYPHTDYAARVEELYAILASMAHGGPRLITSKLRIPLISLQGTTEEPMAGFVRDVIAAEGHDGIRSLTLMHGFPWTDWSEAGASLLVVAENALAPRVEAVAKSFADRFAEIATNAPVRRLGVREAVDAALAAPAGLTVIADSSDNPGGGAACDSTFLLRELLDRDVRNVALGMLWDPQTARIAADAGVGARLPMRLGGKVSPLSGDPVDADVEVLCVREDVRQRNLNGEAVDPIGLAVALRVGGVDVVVNSIRQQVFSTECFTELGIDLSRKSVVVVKSSQHFRASFDRVATQTVYCNAPGALNLDLAAMPWRKVRLRRRGSAFEVEALR